MRVAINGLGRIGKQFFQSALKQDLKDIDFVAINGVSDIENAIYLLKYDSVYGRSGLNIKVLNGHIHVGRHKVKILNERDPSKLPWGKLGVDLVVEATGVFRTKELSMQHIKAGAKKVLITAIAKDADILVIPGVNSDKIKKDHKIISMCSCTTNCVTPMLKLLDDNFKIKKGFMLTTHGVTSSQSLVDGNNSKDFRRGRSGMWNIVPTTTGATTAASMVLTNLKGKIDGYALRVPVLCGSIADLTIEVGKNVTAEKVNEVFKKAASGKMQGVMEYSEDPLVSSDIIGNPHSCIIDASLTKNIGNLINVVGWYDNEFGYSNRLVDAVNAIKKTF